LPKLKIRLEQIANFVKNRLTEMAQRYPTTLDTPEYRWQHTLRVTSYGQQLAEIEGADREQVLAACLLHDVARFDPQDDFTGHGRLGARISRPFLQQLGYPAAVVENICYAIAIHVDNKADFDHPHTLEARVVADADDIDRSSMYRILQYCAPMIEDYPRLIEKAAKRLEELHQMRSSERMQTAAGQAIFATQLEQQIQFYHHLIDESRRTRLPYENHSPDSPSLL